MIVMYIGMLIALWGIFTGDEAIMVAGAIITMFGLML